MPMFFCRYLCPLGATLDPLSRLGLIKIVRDDEGVRTRNSALRHGLSSAVVSETFVGEDFNAMELIDAKYPDRNGAQRHEVLE